MRKCLFFAQQILTNTHIRTNAIFASLLELRIDSSAIYIDVKSQHAANFVHNWVRSNALCSANRILFIQFVVK